MPSERPRVTQLDSPITARAPLGVAAPVPVEAPAPTPTQAPAAREKPVRESKRRRGLSVGELSPPPPLEEAMERLFARAPASLVANLEAMTLALREREPSRATQKGLSRQELLSALLWAMGDPMVSADVDALAAVFARYRSTRYAAAAERLSAGT